jgi:hypothetical protein
LLVFKDLFQLGNPVEHRGIVITPLFPRRDPVAQYVTLDEALPHGFRVREVSDAGLVPELLAENPLTNDVLLYDGEELVGAKQNRILNVSVLVAGTKLPIPVSCVEEGRWHAQSAAFGAAPHAANPRLRRRKAEALQAEPLARGAAQADVWDEVALTADRLEVASPTRANSDAFRAHRPSLAQLEQAFPLEAGQSGAVLALGDNLCLDAVSQPDAFARLWPKLRAGYLLDALDRLDQPAATAAAVGDFIAVLSAAGITQGPAAGRGSDVRVDGTQILGSGSSSTASCCSSQRSPAMFHRTRGWAGSAAQAVEGARAPLGGKRRLTLAPCLDQMVATVVPQGKGFVRTDRLNVQLCEQ